MLTLDDLARWQAIRKDGRVVIVMRKEYWHHRCALCGLLTRINLSSKPMIAHWKREHAQEWSEAQP